MSNDKNFKATINAIPSKLKEFFKRLGTKEFWSMVLDFVLSWNFLIYVLTIGLFLLFMFPLYMIVINAMKDKAEIINNPMGFSLNLRALWLNIQDILTRDNVHYFRSFFYSVIITTISLGAIGIFSSMAAWVLVRTKKWYSTVIFLFFISGLVIPFQVVMLPLVTLLQQLKDLIGLPFKDTLWGIVLA